MLNMQPFEFYRTPKIVFGAGEIIKLGAVARQFGEKALIVRGAESLKKSPSWSTVVSSLGNAGIKFLEYEISQEPSPHLINTAVNQYCNASIDCVIAIGGGSVLDGGKAISAMLPSCEDIVNFLEVVGNKKPDGKKLPFIAVPTTSGTGSETTANAVVSEIGPEGFKRSLRHNSYVPDIALIDPELSLNCPSTITATCGMDTLTQLLESYVSTKSSPFTEALIENALPLVRDHLLNAVLHGSTDINARTGMAYASMVSGVALSNAGLGVVHGLASVLGAMYPIPHGVVCGTLLSPAIKATIHKLSRVNHGTAALTKFAKAGKVLMKNPHLETGEACELLINYLDSLTNTLNMRYLSDFGVTVNDFDTILNENCNKNNPVQLDNNEIKAILSERLSPSPSQ
jgi:alcohol dehydrogenase class IV